MEIQDYQQTFADFCDFMRDCKPLSSQSMQKQEGQIVGSLQHLPALLWAQF